MFKAVDVKVLTFGDKSFPVEQLSQGIQDRVVVFNSISHQEAKLHEQAYTLQAAKVTLQREIEQIWLAEQDAKAKAEKDAADKAAATAVPEAQ